jgi:superfamily I DNA/RNA helicase
VATRDRSFSPSASQRDAIRAEPGPVLVLAGPGAGKTYCLIERIRYLIGDRRVDPARICALTFTNKAAEEVAGRLKRDLGEPAEAITRSTIHALCVRILRAHGGTLGLERGFGIADDEYQLEVLAKQRVAAKRRKALLNTFGLHRLGRPVLSEDDVKIFRRYRAFLEKRRMVDFDDLTHLVVDLFEASPETAASVAAQWDHLLVDEFQDLNPIQYRIVRTLAGAHRNIFVVGDDEQSIFSWTGADPMQLATFVNDFTMTRRYLLRENRRTARHIFELARRLLAGNPTLFEAKEVVAERTSDHPVEAWSFRDEDQELGWLLGDLQRDKDESGLAWGDYAVLYRKHQVGDALEGALMKAGIPCRLAQGRAVGDDRVIRYLLAALRVIAHPGDSVYNEAFVRRVLPANLVDSIRKLAEIEQIGFLPRLRRRARELPNTDEDGRKLRRALYAMQNLTALGHRHEHLPELITEILSQRVGTYQTALEERADELTDPIDDPAAVTLAGELARVRESKGRILLTPVGGAEIGLAGMLTGAGLRLVDYAGVGAEPGPDDLALGPDNAGKAGLVLTVFKALQLESANARDNFRDFVVVDLETTDKDVATAEIVEIAAARVRDWEIVAEFHRLVKPRVAIAPEASKTHGYSDADVADAPHFEDVWPEFQSFIGTDVLVAHNGYEFDFPILRRMATGGAFVTYDTLPLAKSLRLGSAKLQYLAERFGIDPGDPHKALWDVRTLAKVFRKLEEEKVARGRRVALSNILDYLGIALALLPPEVSALPADRQPEAAMLLEVTPAFSLGRFSNCLDFYQAERDRVGESAASQSRLIDQLGGIERMERIRAERRADQRYPQSMGRVRRLLEGLEATDRDEAIAEFLGRVALSKSDGAEADPARVNLLTLHSTKGLEFSRVYIVGVEDAELPGNASGRSPGKEELEESRRLLYVGMTRARDRLVLTRAANRGGRATGGVRFLDEMGLSPREGPEAPPPPAAPTLASGRA